MHNSAHPFSMILQKIRYTSEKEIVFVCYPLLFLQLSFSENGHYGSSEEKEKVAETRQMCYGKGI